jgi:hypothetical protein
MRDIYCRGVLERFEPVPLQAHFKIVVIVKEFQLLSKLFYLKSIIFGKNLFFMGERLRLIRKNEIIIPPKRHF